MRCPKDGSPLVSAVDMTMMTSSAGGGAQVARSVHTSDELAPGSTAGEYEIVEKIGEGGMGMVYGARHPLIGKRAAIKVIHRELSASVEAGERFIREAQAVNQIGHPNIVDVFGFGQLTDGRRFFVMEWLRGESLGKRLERPLPLEEALEILESIAKALEAAHDAGVMHRDLKPDNVFLQERKHEKPVVKLLDFGLAKLSGSNEHGLDTTRTGVVMGTPLYLSPEQAKGEKVDVATDIYSLGAMAYQMFCGEVPFKANSAVETMAMHISQNPVPLSRMNPTIPPEIDHLVRTMLDKDAKRRPTIAQVREQISALRTPGAIMVRESRPSTPLASAIARSDMALAMTTATGPIPKQRKPPLAMILGLVAVAAVGVVLGLVLVGRSAPTPPAAPVEATASEPPPETPPEAPPVTPPTPPTQAAPPPVVAVEKPPAPKPPVRTVKPVEPKPRLGTVVVTVTGVTKARIMIDGKVVAKGVTTITESLPPGEHVVRAGAKGHKMRTSKIRVIAGRTHDVRLELEPQRSVNAVHDPFAED